MNHQDPTRRFANRVDVYIRHRPSYPSQLFDLLEKECGLSTDWTIADIGSGTGILSRLFLKRGHIVFGVEPNVEMRRAAEGLLTGFSGFRSTSATAEETTLKSQSIDLIVAGQAFHWFDPDFARREFGRILKPGGIVALIWNDRRKDSTKFLTEYERLLITFGTDYQKVDHTRLTSTTLNTFFGPGGYRSAAFDNQQQLDFYGLRGRLLSASYIPPENDPQFSPMIRQLHTIYETHQLDGQVALDYDTRIYYGQMS